MSPQSTPIAVAVVVVLASVLAGVGVAADATEPRATTTVATADDVANPPNTTSYLHVSDDGRQRSTYASVGVDVPGTSAVSHDRLQVRLTVERFERAFEDAETAENRTAAIRDAIRRLDNATERLRTRQSTAIDRYNRGQTDAQALVRTLTRVDATAQSIANATDLVQDIDERAIGYVLSDRLDTRLENVRAELATVRGRTVRQRVLRSAVYGGPMADTDVYIESGEDTVAMATILENNYVRETSVGHAFDPSDTLDAQNASSRINDIYSWALQPENLVSVGSDGIGDRIGNTSVQEISINHVQGSFTAYFDGNTSNVYAESQSRRLTDPQPRNVISITNGSLSMSVLATHETGPMLVSVTDNATETAIDGTLFLDGRPVGALGDDGQRWVVNPDGDTTVRVAADTEVVELTIPETALPG